MRVVISLSVRISFQSTETSLCGLAEAKHRHCPFKSSFVSTSHIPNAISDQLVVSSASLCVFASVWCVLGFLCVGVYVVVCVCVCSYVYILFECRLVCSAATTKFARGRWFWPRLLFCSNYKSARTAFYYYRNRVSKSDCKATRISTQESLSYKNLTSIAKSNCSSHNRRCKWV